MKKNIRHTSYDIHIHINRERDICDTISLSVCLSHTLYIDLRSLTFMHRNFCCYIMSIIPDTQKMPEMWSLVRCNIFEWSVINVDVMFERVTRGRCWRITHVNHERQQTSPVDNWSIPSSYLQAFHFSSEGRTSVPDGQLPHNAGGNVSQVSYRD